MTARSQGVTKLLHKRLLEDQRRRAEAERRLSFAEKLRILDQLIAAGPPKVEPSSRKGAGS